MNVGARLLTSPPPRTQDHAFLGPSSPSESLAGGQEEPGHSRHFGPERLFSSPLMAPHSHQELLLLGHLADSCTSPFKARSYLQRLPDPLAHSCLSQPGTQAATLYFISLKFPQVAQHCLRPAPTRCWVQQSLHRPHLAFMAPLSWWGDWTNQMIIPALYNY